VHPTEKAKLLFEIAFLQRHHKANKSDRIQCEADDAVICGEGKQLCIREDNVLSSKVRSSRPCEGDLNHLEIVDDALAI
jgi:hypothetical protein